MKKKLIKYITLPSSRQKIQLFPNFTNRKMGLFVLWEKNCYCEKSTLVLLFSSLRPFKKSLFFFLFFCYCLYRITVWMGNRMTLNWKCFLFFTTYYLLLWHNTTTYIEWIENKVGKRECFSARPVLVKLLDAI